LVALRPLESPVLDVGLEGPDIGLALGGQVLDLGLEVPVLGLEDPVLGSGLEGPVLGLEDPVLGSGLEGPVLGLVVLAWIINFAVLDWRWTKTIFGLAVDYFVCVRLFCCMISACMLYYCNTVR